MIATNIGSSHGSNIWDTSSIFSLYSHMVDLVCGVSIRLGPGVFMNILVFEKGPTDH